ncbi:alanine/ornithine racemase family PLP-dependent enzyme [soil metagenome]
MSCPRLEIYLDRLHHNAALLVDRLGHRGIGVTGITKATLGSPEVAASLLAAGVTGLGESRIENVERLRAAGITAPITLIRSPMISQVARVVAHADVSLNTEPAVLAALSAEAVRQHRTHGVIVMVELGDLREGILPRDLPDVLTTASALNNLEIKGIGANLACQYGIAPDDDNMAVLSALAEEHQARTGQRLATVSGGNSATYEWALATEDSGRVNDLRLGEAILLGRETLHRRPIDGLRTDAITLVAEVIERSCKPAEAWGTRAQTAFGRSEPPTGAVGHRERVIVALGRQDVDPDGLVPPTGLRTLGASSDHLVLGVDGAAPGPAVGDEVRFAVDYSALLRAMTSPSVHRTFLDHR